MTRVVSTVPLLYVLDDRHHKLQIHTSTRYEWYRLGHPPATDPYTIMAEILIRRELGYRLKPECVHYVQWELAGDIKRGVRAWTPVDIRDILEDLRIAFSMHSLAEGRVIHGPTPTAR